jgi:hypothetical protein
MARSDEVGEVTRYLLSLVEDPRKLAEFKRDPDAALQAANLSEGAIAMVRANRPVGGGGGTTIIVIALIIIVVA